MKTKFCLFMVCCLIFLEFSLGLNESDVLIIQKNIDSNNQVTFLIKLPQNYTMAKAPTIVSELNDSEFFYTENFKHISDNEYETVCTINPQHKDNLKFDLYICNQICSIVTKHVPINDENSSSLWLLLLFGFLGGALLNVMPCVLPVLLLKLRQLRSKVAVVGSICGIYLCFFVLGCILTFLKLSGEAVGWGFYFQNEYFLKCIAVLFFIFTLNAFGWISFSWNISLKKIPKGEFVKNVMTSVISTLIAIPCTAPLLGTAAAFAIQGTVTELFLIFFAIASGFAIPYFLSYSVNEKLTQIFKTPVVQKIVPFAALCVFVWIASLLVVGLSIIQIILVILAFCVSAILFKKSLNGFALVLLIPIFFIRTAPPVRNFDLKEINQIVDGGQTVIVNVTADWCLSCQYNKLKLKSAVVQNEIKKLSAEFKEVDMTKKNDEVLQFIKNYGRAGIPFTIIFGPTAKKGLLLPEILQEKDIIRNLRKASEVSKKN